ncbi:hypothetical protein V494_04226 [Pseudogymnoascus sp. VKM F-4513 (FW-928)]|nr:hypothetical protein V494_04226 [Pseudogymnoascus sp. VKM F-4513 (FW-928)]
MACPVPLRVNLRRISSVRPQNFRPIAPIRRSFFSLPDSELVTLRETRILPYESSSLYTLIADVDRYSSFIPYCQESRVTKWSEPDTKGKRWPEQADLKVGWGGLEETFTSKLNCVPDTIVEALGGDAVPAQSLGRLSRVETQNNIFKRLSTRWTVKPLPGQPAASGVARNLTEVNLAIEFQFSNPLYGSLSKAVAPKLAEVMIEAFEKRAKLLLDNPTARQ